jgi:D-serine dehydratase
MTTDIKSIRASLQRGQPTTLLRPPGAPPSVPALPPQEIQAVEERFARFAALLSALFPDSGWNGRVASPLLRYPHPHAGLPEFWLKADHLLPMTGSVKARGGVHEVLCAIEDFAIRERLLDSPEDTSALLDPRARAALSRYQIIVASTGNLGFTVGLVTRAFGIACEVHMSADAKAWKKDRLRKLGAIVIEHNTDYEGAVAAARARAADSGAYFVDDERSRRLFAGYAAAGRELAQQLAAEGEHVSVSRPLVVYLPCGVGGAPGGIMAGLLQQFGDALVVVFVEPIGSACMLTALATGERTSVYSFGLDNKTIADGLAVPTASQLALDLIGPRVDGAVAVPDAMLLSGVRMAWRNANLRLEPSAAAGFMGMGAFLEARAMRGDPVREAVHVAWTTGGSLLPDAEFLPLVE